MVAWPALLVIDDDKRSTDLSVDEERMKSEDVGRP
jgi:hypothetical protein